MAKYTVFLSEPEAAETDLVGNEAKQLHLLMENAVRVPDGFVVTADTLEEFLTHSGAGEKIAHLFSGDVKDERGLDILSRQAVEVVKGAEMSWDIEADLVGAYEHIARQQDIGSPRVWVAVSVAFHPDRFPYFANTFERRSVLHDRRDLDKAVKEAWASLYSPETLRYFREIEWDLRDVRASVLVQHGVAPEASGVAVAVPDDQGGHDLIVKVVLGSAMSLEKGTVEPDTYIVNMETGEVSDRDTRTQEVFHYPDEKGRMRPLRLPPDLASQPKLPEEACAELARLSRLAMKIFGQPMVLEWALVGEDVWIVDAIPLAAIEDMADEEEVEPEPAPVPPPSSPAPAVAPEPQPHPYEDDQDMMDALAAFGFAPKRKATPPPPVEVAPAPPQPEPEPEPEP
ncbi:MAG: hypothetical protein JSW25_10070, partial [Thermoplasmata archaeon]